MSRKIYDEIANIYIERDKTRTAWDESHPKKDEIKIEKRFVDDPNDWFPTSEYEFLRHTEDAGYWKPGTALQTLRDMGTLRTPFALYHIAKEEKR